MIFDINNNRFPSQATDHTLLSGSEHGQPDFGLKGHLLSMKGKTNRPLATNLPPPHLRLS
jgi:hypothetical protein